MKLSDMVFERAIKLVNVVLVVIQKGFKKQIGRKRSSFLADNYLCRLMK